tara:strand:- start:130 stop:411 length:282 start_codon:yes stop_codon:yes gene_type:complete
MISSLKKEVKKYIHKNQSLKKELKNIGLEKEIMKKIPQKIKKGIKEIKIEKELLTIITHSPSWRQETLFFKKEIMKKIHKKLPNYTIEKIIIL